jgi:predicted component of type VI protein secretion system
MPAQLLSLTDGPSILLDKPILLIGRHPECDIQIDSRKVSRRHCCIAQVGDYLVVRDLGSTNGIRINGVRVLEGKLKERDELAIAGNRYNVSWEVSPAPVHPVAAPRIQQQHRALPSAMPEEDELLEACDEPIPLAEPAEPPPGPWIPPPTNAASSRAADPPASFPVEKSPLPLIPENLDLAPSSDSLEGQSFRAE